MAIGQQAAPGAGKRQVAEDPMPYVLLVLGRHGGLPGVGLRQHQRPTGQHPGQPLRGGQVTGHPGSRGLVHRAGGPAVTVTALTTGRRQSGLLDKLLTAVRAEFRTEIYHPAPADPVFVASQCAVADCDRVIAQLGLCTGTSSGGGSGDAGDGGLPRRPGPPVRGRQVLPSCRIGGCRYGRFGKGLCCKHYDRWVRAGRPAADQWQAPSLAAAGIGTAECRLPFCSLWVETPEKVFCQQHHDRWKRASHRDIERFIVDRKLNGTAAVDLRGLPPQLTLEFQYGLQCRAEARRHTTPARYVMQAVRHSQAAGVASLLDLSEQQWRQQARTGRVRAPVLLLIEIRDAVELLRNGAGWENKFGRDVWRLDRLPGITTPATATVSAAAGAAALRTHPAALAAGPGQTVAEAAADQRVEYHRRTHWAGRTGLLRRVPRPRRRRPTRRPRPSSARTPPRPRRLPKRRVRPEEGQDQQSEPVPAEPLGRLTARHRRLLSAESI